MLERAAHALAGFVERPGRARPGGYRRFARKVVALEDRYAAFDDERLAAEAEALRAELPRSGFAEAELVRTFALVRETAWRTLGVRHYECQIIGGLVMFRGAVAEMATGEGKTLTAALPACAAALAGVPVHVVTVNDYLTQRDAEELSPLYAALGISLGCIVHELDPPARRRAYESAVTYCTNKELVFDYLRDQMLLADRTHHLRLEADRLAGREARGEQLLLRGLHFAIVDEADSVLVDEARTPLIISSTRPGNPEEDRVFDEALALARRLESGRDFHHDLEQRRVRFTDEGRLTVADEAAVLGPYWTGRARREELVRQALSALHLFERDRHYLVREGKVEIVDEHTGRIMADRTWERGLQQLIERKEDCEPTRPRETLARISYQRFFRQYQHLSGMTGTAREIEYELWAVYGLPVVAVPLNRPSRRRRYPERVFATSEEKWEAVVQRVRELHEQDRPVLVGTHTVQASEELSARLAATGLPHQVLNAKQDGAEAEVIAEAGLPGQITVATNMAGRGTDIKLGPGAARVEGLHVLLTERHESGRIDRQLEGRGARQGDPGSFEPLVSLEDYLVRGRRGGVLAWLARSAVAGALDLRGLLGRRATDRAQRRLERLHAKVRRELLKTDERQAERLAFAGRKG